MANKKKTHVSKIDGLPAGVLHGAQEPLSSASSGFGIADLLGLFGTGREDVKARLLKLGINDPDRAFAFLRSLEYIPSDIAPDRFEAIYRELMA
jgi:hypothetical protein